VFTSERDGQDDLFLADADGRIVRRLTDDPSREHFAAVSPDDSTVAFVSNRDGGADRLYLIDDDGKNLRRLENSVLSVPDGRGRTDPITPRGTSPAFSPDGRQILFVVPTPQPGSDLYLMDRDGSNPVRIPVGAMRTPTPSPSNRTAGGWSLPVKATCISRTSTAAARPG
jgi:dipeptidyl aminopeptidase/acylaminoacyl peptidase